MKPYLKEQAKVAVGQTYTVIQTRIDQFGVTQPNVQLLGDRNQILIELPGITEPERVRKLLQGTAKLEFYKAFDNSEAYGTLSGINNLLAAKSKSTKKDTAKTAAKTAAGKSDTGKTGSLLSKINKSTGKDTSALAGKSQQAEQNPLFSILRANVVQGPNGIELSRGPVIGLWIRKTQPGLMLISIARI